MNTCYLYICPSPQNMQCQRGVLLWSLHDYDCQYKFINDNKCFALVGDVDNGRGYACVVVEGYGKALYLSLSFAVNIKLL